MQTRPDPARPERLTALRLGRWSPLGLIARHLVLRHGEWSVAAGRWPDPDRGAN